MVYFPDLVAAKERGEDITARLAGAYVIEGCTITATDTKDFAVLQEVAAGAPVQQLDILAMGRTDTEAREILLLFPRLERLSLYLARFVVKPSPPLTALPWGSIREIKIDWLDRDLPFPDELVMESLARCPTLAVAVLPDIVYIPRLHDDDSAPFFPALERLETTVFGGPSVSLLSRMRNLRSLRVSIWWTVLDRHNDPPTEGDIRDLSTIGQLSQLTELAIDCCWGWPKPMELKGAVAPLQQLEQLKLTQRYPHSSPGMTSIGSPAYHNQLTHDELWTLFGPHAAQRLRRLVITIPWVLTPEVTILSAIATRLPRLRHLTLDYPKLNCERPPQPVEEARGRRFSPALEELRIFMVPNRYPGLDFAGQHRKDSLTAVRDVLPNLRYVFLPGGEALFVPGICSRAG